MFPILPFTSILKFPLILILSFLLCNQVKGQNEATTNSVIEHAPVADSYNISITKIPTKNQSIILNGSFPSVGSTIDQLTGRDYEDADTYHGLNGRAKKYTVVITDPIAPLNIAHHQGPKMFYNGQPIESQPISPKGGYMIKNYNADLLEVRVNGLENDGFQFEYTWIDLAGIQGLPATYKVSWQSTALPVKLTDFSISQELHHIQLSWSTTEESNFSRFEIEHSVTGKIWQVISTVGFKGKENEFNHYSATHENPSSGNNYYRLKMIDQDNSYSFSRISQITLENLGIKAFIYPNPVSETLFINNLDDAIIDNISIVNYEGRSVYNKTDVNNISNYGINVSSFLAGNYYLKVQMKNGEYYTEKLLIRH